jgi:hypothetical protein
MQKASSSPIARANRAFGVIARGGWILRDQANGADAFAVAPSSG